MVVTRRLRPTTRMLISKCTRFPHDAIRHSRAILAWSCLLITSGRLGVSAAKTQWAVQLRHPTESRFLTLAEAHDMALSHNFDFLGKVGDLDGYYLFETETSSSSEALNPSADVESSLKRRTVSDVTDLLLEHHNVGWFEMQRPRKRAKRTVAVPPVMPRDSSEQDEMIKALRLEADSLGFKDPKFPSQWHLFNDGFNGLVKGNDINVIPLWKRGINGSGVTVSIIDDGVEYTHPDFELERWSSESSYDFNERTNTPLPQSAEDIHGTRCAGEIGASPNYHCGVGVAFGVRLAAERLIADSTTDAVEAQALNYKNQINDIYSSSWGPNDDGMSVDGPGFLATNALIAGVERGRGGKGSIFVFASGNGGLEGDNCNFDGYANSIYTVAIGAINSAGRMPPYGEICSAQLAVTYSGGQGIGIWTSDIGSSCTGVHSGTSAAAPIASGIIALVLSVRPDLRWRDIQQLIVETAQMADPDDEGWKKNGAGRYVSHKYGFGKLDASMIVNRAESYLRLPEKQIKFSKSRTLNTEITAGNAGQSRIVISDQIEVVSKETSPFALDFLEHVEVTVRIDHDHRKYLNIILVSPAGTESILATPRMKDDSDEGLNPWTFMTVLNWGESPTGRWTIKVMDLRHEFNQDVDRPFKSLPEYSFPDGTKQKLPKPGVFIEWAITLHGTCKGPVPNPTNSQERICVSQVAALPSDTFANETLPNAAIGFLIVSLISVIALIMIFFLLRLRNHHRLKEKKLQRPLLESKYTVLQPSLPEKRLPSFLTKPYKFVVPLVGPVRYSLFSIGRKESGVEPDDLRELEEIEAHSWHYSHQPRNLQIPPAAQRPSNISLHSKLSGLSPIGSPPTMRTGSYGRHLSQSRSVEKSSNYSGDSRSNGISGEESVQAMGERPRRFERQRSKTAMPYVSPVPSEIHGTQNNRGSSSGTRSPARAREYSVGRAHERVISANNSPLMSRPTVKTYVRASSIKDFDSK